MLSTAGFESTEDDHRLAATEGFEDLSRTY